MLVLTRKAQEQIQIGEDVVVTILRVKGQSVRVGIEAPRNVRVLRAELPRNESMPIEPAMGASAALSPEEFEDTTDPPPAAGKPGNSRPLSRNRMGPLNSFPTRTRLLDVAHRQTLVLNAAGPASQQR